MARKIVVNLDTSKEIYTIFKSKQNDDLILEVNVFENGEGLDLTNKEIAIQALKGDNTYIIQNTDITKLNNTFTAELVRNFTRVPGTTKIEVVLVEGGKQNTTFSFYLEVVGSVIRGAVESKDSITSLEKMQDAVIEIGKINEETQTLLNNAGAASKEEINKVNTQLAEMDNKKAPIELIGQPTQEQVNNWLNDNPQAVTTVQDKSITYKKLDEKIGGLFEEVYEKVNVDSLWVENYWIKNGNYYEANNGFKTAKITVNQGEKFKISGYMLSNQRLYIVRDSQDLDRTNGGGANGLLQYLPNGETTATWTLVENREFEIPSSGRYLYVCTPMATDKLQYFKLEKLTGYKVKEEDNYSEYIDNLNKEINDLNNKIINEQLKNDFSWGNPDKLYVTFCFDDSLADISDIETLFEQKGVPCCFATIPNRLSNITNSGETVKQVLQRAIANGGEVLSHWGTPLLPTSTDEDYYNVYVGAKKTLVNEGFEVDGIITAGGGDFALQDWNKDILLARPYYRYADLTDFNNTGVEQYLNRRCFLTTDNATNKANIDTFIEKGQLNRGGDLTYYGKYRWLPLASHGVNDKITISILSELIDYIKSKSNVQIVNYKYLFDKFSSSKLEKRLLALENK